jgi:cathepsin A (carboxypeptidase C)
MKIMQLVTILPIGSLLARGALALMMFNGVDMAITDEDREELTKDFNSEYFLPSKLSKRSEEILGNVTGIDGVSFSINYLDDTIKPPETQDDDNAATVRSIKKRDANEYDHILTAETGHKMRLKSPTSLELDSVKQFAGYFDTPSNDHFFFWMFESRKDPAKDPVILWLNGGPGCSSMTGMLFENGPSSIDSRGQIVRNPYSWNSEATVIYLDQPVNVGFSYSDKLVSSSAEAAEDVVIFLDLFFKHFGPLSHRKFHIAGESYSGHYIPAIVDEIHRQKLKSFNVSSVMIGNGLVDPLSQYPAYGPMACGEGGYHQVLSNDRCDVLRSQIPMCRRLVETCYNHPDSTIACGGATVLCSTLANPYRRTNLNPYDIREVCVEPPLCYQQLIALDEYMNEKKVKEAVGAEVNEFVSCSNTIQK